MVSGSCVRVCEQPLTTGSTTPAVEEISLQRKARRAHRKRIARIVCQQWLSFAEDRLRAYRHHRRKLLVAGVLAFRQACEHHQRALRNAMVLRGRIKYRQVIQVLLAWLTTARRLQQVRTMVSGCQVNKSASVLKQSIAWWRAYVMQQHRKQRIVCKALYFRSFILTSNAMRALQTHMQQRRHKALLKARAVGHDTRRAYRRAWVSWRYQVTARAHMARLTQRAAAHSKRAALQRALQGWKCTCRSQITARAAWVLRLHHVGDSIDRVALSAALVAWASYAAQARSLRATQAAFTSRRGARMRQIICSMCASAHRIISCSFDMTMSLEEGRGLPACRLAAS